MYFHVKQEEGKSQFNGQTGVSIITLYSNLHSKFIFKIF